MTPIASLLIPLAASGAAAISLSASAGCKTAVDCSLGGKCVEGRCQCYPIWQGTKCEVLAIGEASNASTNGYRNPNGASWGGSAIRADDGSYHMFVSFISRDCGLNSWKFNSVIHHAVSANPDGPYSFKDEVLSEFAHNPTITRAPDGTYLLYHIGETLSADERSLYLRDCRKGRHAEPKRSANSGGPANFDGRIRIAFSKSLDGPWSLLNNGTPIIQPRRGSYWDTAVTNPAPLILKNGSVFLYYRGDDRFHPDFDGQRHRKIGAFFAQSWTGPYHRIRDTPITPSGEDPVVFANSDGSGYHMIFENKFKGIVGQHAFSVDGKFWQIVEDPAYDLLASWDGGSSTRLQRRERPQLLLDERGEPLYLFNAVQGSRDRGEGRSAGQSTWTMAAPLGFRFPTASGTPPRHPEIEAPGSWHPV
mmetsp:Transcript_71840/g.200500  ORF Transcript_71840/g.200500 Transcript_71840/m.200500 type:complete len:420 (-) Transcript_71840:172-1431(-)